MAHYTHGDPSAASAIDTGSQKVPGSGTLADMTPGLPRLAEAPSTPGGDDAGNRPPGRRPAGLFRRRTRHRATPTPRRTLPGFSGADTKAATRAALMPEVEASHYTIGRGVGRALCRFRDWAPEAPSGRHQAPGHQAPRGTKTGTIAARNRAVLGRQPQDWKGAASAPIAPVVRDSGGGGEARGLPGPGTPETGRPRGDRAWGGRPRAGKGSGSTIGTRNWPAGVELWHDARGT